MDFPVVDLAPQIPDRPAPARGKGTGGFLQTLQAQQGAVDAPVDAAGEDNVAAAIPGKLLGDAALLNGEVVAGELPAAEAPSPATDEAAATAEPALDPALLPVPAVAPEAAPVPTVTAETPADAVPTDIAAPAETAPQMAALEGGGMRDTGFDPAAVAQPTHPDARQPTTPAATPTPAPATPLGVAEANEAAGRPTAAPAVRPKAIGDTSESLAQPGPETVAEPTPDAAPQATQPRQAANEADEVLEADADGMVAADDDQDAGAKKPAPYAQIEALRAPIAEATVAKPTGADRREPKAADAVSSPAAAAAAAASGAGASAILSSHTLMAASRAASTPQPIAEQITMRIEKAAKEGADRISLSLKPAELGRVDVQMEFAADGRLQAVISVDRPETLALLQRDQRGLEQALQNAGFRTEDGSLNFNLRQNGQQQAGAENDREQGNGSRGQEPTGEPTTIAAPTTPQSRRIALGGLDLKV